ncbi:hypothetical protein P8452_74095 [Trifolium repens]|nr:hypothetical protein P8452_74095 [Trifolium repens]
MPRVLSSPSSAIHSGRNVLMLPRNVDNKVCDVGEAFLLSSLKRSKLKEQMHFTVLLLAVESAGLQTPIAFLEHNKENFSKKYAGGKAENRSNGDFLSKVKAQVTEVKGVMMENIEKI